jgi:hypothetical protein
VGPLVREAPEALRRWADSSVIGMKRMGGRRRVAGWTWDGVSDHIDLLLAPKGSGVEPIPRGVWERMARESGWHLQRPT